MSETLSINPTQVKYCVGCGTALHQSAISCPKCGAAQGQILNSPAQSPSPALSHQTPQSGKGADQKYCSSCANIISVMAVLCPRCGAPQSSGGYATSSKSKATAIILALFLGGIGIHKFYLGRMAAGILYLLFFWTFIPAVIAFVDAIILATMSDEKFANEYR